MSQEVRLRVQAMSEMACRTILKTTGLLERVLMKSVLVSSVVNMVFHRSVWSSALITAASRELWDKMKEV